MKKTFSRLLFALSASAVMHASAAADFPDRTMRWIVPYAAGGTTDVMARHLAAEMGPLLGQTVVIDNKPGAASIIGATQIARSTPDGYTFGTVDSGTLAFNPALYSELTYDVEKDFTFIGGLGRMPLVLAVNPNFPAKSLQEFMEIVRKEPGKTTSASSGHGSPLHVALELFNQREGVSLLHVPYKGSAPALQDLMSGQVDSMFVDLPPSIQMIHSGKLRVLAVATPKRLDVLPDVPTFDELGIKGFEAYAWQGFVSPKNTPEAVVGKLSTALNTALKSEVIGKKFDALGIQPMPMEPAEFEAFAKSEGKLWGDVIRKAGIKLD
ncbi:Bug family tripartite tricarboxylate transporter substrate binding protein [Parapusillimonas sp. JC17]|uniref:Bug family tripartite tricarboxylate transporter substrate binding protein n=1 Tax=Parapusillimonas sp. JC17 TaxID=3445768 RepID=UPI003FA17EB1